MVHTVISMRVCILDMEYGLQEDHENAEGCVEKNRKVSNDRVCSRSN